MQLHGPVGLFVTFTTIVRITTIAILSEFQSLRMRIMYCTGSESARYEGVRIRENGHCWYLVSSMQCCKAEDDAEADACTTKDSDRTLEHGPYVGNNSRDNAYETSHGEHGAYAVALIQQTH